jgi:hypothetical protein
MKLYGELEVAEIEPPPPDVTTEIRIGTVTSAPGVLYTESFRNSDGTLDENGHSLTLGVPIGPLEDCVCDGGQSSSGDPVIITDSVSIENFSWDGSMSIASSGSSVMFHFDATAKAKTKEFSSSDQYDAYGHSEGTMSTDPEQVALIIENNTTTPVNIIIGWLGSSEFDFSGDFTSGHSGFGLTISGIDDQTIYFQSEYSKYPDWEEGTPSGSQTIEIPPGRHCFYLSVYFNASVHAQASDDDPSPRSGTVNCTGSINVSVQ